MGCEGFRKGCIFLNFNNTYFMMGGVADGGFQKNKK